MRLGFFRVCTTSPWQWGVFEVFADTIVVCTLTALVILTTGVVDLESGAVLAGVQDNALVGQAFTAAFGSFGPKFIAVSILLFAYSTTLCRIVLGGDFSDFVTRWHPMGR